MFLYEEDVRTMTLDLIRGALEDGLPNVGFIEGVMALHDALTKKEDQDGTDKND